MTTEQLRYFITIVDVGSYMDAALELNISQSSVSKHIKSLEDELGITLFDRKSRKAKLTSEGKALLPEARLLLEKMEHFLTSAEKMKPNYAKRFLVATLPFIGYLGFYPSLIRFEMENQDYHLTVIEEEEPQLMRRLLVDDFDIIITYEYEYRLSNKGQDFLPIASDEIVLVVHRQSPLASRQTVTLSDIEDCPLLLMEPYTCVSKLCMLYFKEHGYIPNIIFRGRPETIFGGAETRRGFAMMTRKQARCYATKDSIAVPLEPALPVTIGAILNSKKKHRKQMEQLVRFLSSCC